MPCYQVDSEALPEWAVRYAPFSSSGDLQTIAARYWPARFDDARWGSETRFFETEPGVQVSARVNAADRDVLMLVVHGLTACSEARYMLTLAGQALEAGFGVIRLNVRNCGGTEHLSPTLYHSGLTTDLRAVIDQLAPRPLFVVGFSMGGNMALKLAGEWEDKPPGHVLGVCSISAPIRLADCSKRIGEFRNRVYELRFLRQLKAALRKKRELQPEIFPEWDFSGVDSIWEFDDRFTAPSFGFGTAANYYQQASAAGYLDRIRAPALALQAEDDPFIPFDAYRDSVFESNPALNLIVSRHGGHVAFLANGSPRFWAEDQAIRFAQTIALGQQQSEHPA